MLPGEVTSSSRYRSTRGQGEDGEQKALPPGGPDPILLTTFCAPFAAAVDFSTCRRGWPVFTGLLSTQSTSALRRTYSLPLAANLACRARDSGVFCVRVNNVGPLEKNHMQKNATVSEADFWYQTSLTTAGSCFPWLELVIGVFSIRAEKVQPASTSVMEPQAQHICLSVKGVLWKDHLSSKWSYRADPRCLYASVDDKAGLAQFYTAWTFGASRLHVSHQLPHAMTRQHLSTTKTCSSCFHICSLKVQPYASKLEWITAAAMTLLPQDLCLKMLHCGSFY